MPVSVLLMILLVIIFAVQCVNDVYLQTTVERWLALTSESLTRGYLWQFLTFQFLHGSVLHLVCNLLGLWFFGRFVEAVIGWRRFLLAYFGSGVMGGILQSVLMTLFPTHFGFFVYGASAGVSGMFAIFARLLPDSVLMTLRDQLSARFLREVSLRDVDREAEEKYFPRPEFYRAIADHIAGMTDSFILLQYAGIKRVVRR